MLVRYLLLPAIAPILIVALYFTPVTLIGCANRGILALVVALCSAVLSVVMSVKAIRNKRAGNAASAWQILSAAILAIPVALLVGPLG